MRILIVESNSRALLAEGRSGAMSFVRTLLAIAPECALEIVAPYAAAFDPSAARDADGVIFTGSGVMWATDAPEAAPLRNAMEQVFAQSIPSWGSCNGLQLAAVVLGGGVGASAKGREDGLARDVQLMEPGHAMMSGRQNGYAVPCIHRDEVTKVPTGAQVLAGNAHSPVQAMVYEQDGVSFWGTQYHPEMTLADVADCHWDPDLVATLSQAETSEEAARQVGTSHAEQQHETRATELRNWIQMLKHRAASGSDTVRASA